MDDRRPGGARMGDAPANPLDRIYVRDYVCEVEIGAFRSERGVTQRLLFNVILDVAAHDAARDDDVDKVVSYDLITRAIDQTLSAERVNLLETLAERIAQICLAHRSVSCATVRIEKLDRIPGALGIEIVRNRPPDPDLPESSIAAGAVKACDVVIFGLDPSAEPDLVIRWLDVLAQARLPVVLCVPPMSPPPEQEDEAALRIGLLSVAQKAWRLTQMDPRVTVVASRTELAWACHEGRLAVVAPEKMVTDAVARPDVRPADPATLAVWLARELGAARILVLGGDAPTIPTIPVRILDASKPGAGIPE